MGGRCAPSGMFRYMGAKLGIVVRYVLDGWAVPTLRGIPILHDKSGMLWCNLPMVPCPITAAFTCPVLPSSSLGLPITAIRYLPNLTTWAYCAKRSNKPKMKYLSRSLLRWFYQIMFTSCGNYPMATTTIPNGWVASKLGSPVYFEV